MGFKRKVKRHGGVTVKADDLAVRHAQLMRDYEKLKQEKTGAVAAAVTVTSNKFIEVMRKNRISEERAVLISEQVIASVIAAGEDTE